MPNSSEINTSTRDDSRLHVSPLRASRRCDACAAQMQGPMVLVEHLVRSQLKQRHVQLPRWVSIPLTLAILLAVGHAYFFPPPMDSGLADRVVASIKENYQSAANALMPGR